VLARYLALTTQTMQYLSRGKVTENAMHVGLALKSKNPQCLTADTQRQVLPLQVLHHHGKATPKSIIS